MCIYSCIFTACDRKESKTIIWLELTGTLVTFMPKFINWFRKLGYEIPKLKDVNQGVYVRLQRVI